MLKALAGILYDVPAGPLVRRQRIAQTFLLLGTAGFLALFILFALGVSWTILGFAFLVASAFAIPGGAIGRRVDD